MYNDKPTIDLDSILGSTYPDQLGTFLKENQSFMVSSNKQFYYFFTDALQKHGIKQKDLFISANISESLGGQYIRMEKHTKNRDVIIRLCLAGHFDLEETNKSLKLYGMNELYSKNKRDACFIVSINSRIYDFDKIDEILKEHGEKPITKKE